MRTEPRPKLLVAALLKTIVPFMGLAMVANGMAPEGAALALVTIAFADRLIESC